MGWDESESRSLGRSSTLLSLSLSLFSCMHQPVSRSSRAGGREREDVKAEKKMMMMREGVTIGASGSVKAVTRRKKADHGTLSACACVCVCACATRESDWKTGGELFVGRERLHVCVCVCAGLT